MRTRLSLLLPLAAAAATLLGGCASPGVIADATPTSPSAPGALTLEIHHDPAVRPAMLRLASAEYRIDGQAVVQLKAGDGSEDQVEDLRSWTGRLTPGDHVLEADLRYPARSGGANDVAFEVQQRYTFRSTDRAPLHIRVEESAEGTMLSASVLARKLGVRFNVF